MKIRTKLLWSAALIIGIIVILVGAALYVSFKTGSAGNRQRVAEEILKISFDRMVLRQEYGVTHEDRPKIQWYALHDRLGNILNLAAPQFTEPSYQALFGSIHDNHERTKTIFDALIGAVAQGSNSALVERLNSELSVIGQSRTTDALRLAELGRAEHEQAHQALNLTVGVLGLLAVGFAFTSFFISKKITNALVILQKNFTAIAALDFTTTTTTIIITGTKDELGNLASAFNMMVLKLKESYGGLEEKIRVRMQSLENAKIAARNVLEDLQVEKENLAEIQAKDEAMLASIGDGMLAVDENGRVVTMSRATEKMLGWRLPEIQGKDLFEINPAVDERGEFIPKGKRLIYGALTTTSTSTSTTTTTTHYYIRRDGTRFPVISTVAPIILGGKIIGAIESFIDITKEKEIEKLRSDFLALASHQLRTPLSGTKWLIETMQRGVTGKLTAKQKEYITQIYSINERMIKLVFDMLNVLRLESAVPELQKKIFTVDEIIKDLILRSETAAEARHIAIQWPSAGKELNVQTDFEALKSILECFLSNAINYSHPEKDIIFDIKEDPKELTFSVKDQGIGIPQDEQKRIFERFYRAANAKDFKPDGTGLGLYAATMLAERIGAKVSFESEEGKGSIFYLRVPKAMSTNNKITENH